jgi:polysaccharide deacetylase 2 family uncharacterized protein YibQ
MSSIVFCKLFFFFLILPLCADDSFLLKKDLIEKRYKHKSKDQKIKICVIIHNFGKHDRISNIVLNRIPGEFALSLSPYHALSKDLIKKVKILKNNILFIQPTGHFNNSDNLGDPYRLNIYHDKVQNDIITEQTLKIIPLKIVGIAMEQGSFVLQNEENIKTLFDYLKEKNRPLFLPEMPLNHNIHKICEKFKVQLFEADYYVKKEYAFDEVTALLERAKDLAFVTGFLLLAVEEHIFNLKTVIDWLQKMPQDEIQLVSFKDLICE